MSTAEKYVTAAYLAIFLAVLVYVVVIAAKLARLEREVADLTDRVRARQTGENARREEEVKV
jgi:CcmD family protein